MPETFGEGERDIFKKLEDVRDQKQAPLRAAEAQKAMALREAAHEAARMIAGNEALQEVMRREQAQERGGRYGEGYDRESSMQWGVEGQLLERIEEMEREISSLEQEIVKKEALPGESSEAAAVLAQARGEVTARQNELLRKREELRAARQEYGAMQQRHHRFEEEQNVAARNGLAFAVDSVIEARALRGEPTVFSKDELLWATGETRSELRRQEQEKKDREHDEVVEVVERPYLVRAEAELDGMRQRIYVALHALEQSIARDNPQLQSLRKILGEKGQQIAKELSRTSWWNATAREDRARGRARALRDEIEATLAEVSRPLKEVEDAIREFRNRYFRLPASKRFHKHEKDDTVLVEQGLDARNHYQDKKKREEMDAMRKKIADEFTSFAEYCAKKIAEYRQKVYQGLYPEAARRVP